MNKTFKIVTMISVVFAFTVSVILVHYGIQIPFLSLDKIIPLQISLIVYAFYLLLSFLENREEYKKHNKEVTMAFFPLVMIFLAFKGGELLPQIYSNLGYSSFFVLLILIDVVKKKSLQEEIEQFNKNRG